MSYDELDNPTDGAISPGKMMFGAEPWLSAPSLVRSRANAHLLTVVPERRTSAKCRPSRSSTYIPLYSTARWPLGRPWLALRTPRMFHETARTNPVRSTSRIAALHVARMFGLQSRRGNISDPGSYKSMRLDPDGLYCNVFLSAFTGPKWWKISKTRREGKARRAWYQAKTQKTSDLTEPNRPHE
ncbi:hypothetical protein Pst134EA_000862 [Puccinia striiformis f. sp. tritici]|uniref:hypothetical protein n=1 Tax=Puccinia striiformis f. sp. tritici TaxID=168172 RepID=UPI0020078138|nr:hypothetical protein Pst134EA_000862 [Puccinia striiformis f. sp. tritici]KAH9473797.1 hypothetical protein Pst134EA_000862 [Puccinia striiformis f. sp. tritici]